MPVTITKVKVKAVLVVTPKVEIEPSLMDDAALADRYGTLSDKIDALMADPLFNQFTEVKAELQKRLDEIDHDAEVKFKGAHWLVAAGVCSKSPRKILDNAKVAQFLGKDTFAKLAKIAVGDAEKYLTPEQVGQVVSKEAFTKNRKITASFLG